MHVYWPIVCNHQYDNKILVIGIIILIMKCMVLFLYHAI